MVVGASDDVLLARRRWRMTLRVSKEIWRRRGDGERRRCGPLPLEQDEAREEADAVDARLPRRRATMELLLLRRNEVVRTGDDACSLRRWLLDDGGGGFFLLRVGESLREGSN